MMVLSWRRGAEVGGGGCSFGSSAILSSPQGGSRILADVYISLYVLIHFYICLCVFAHFLFAFVYTFWIFVHVKLIVNKRGRRRHPPLISLSILFEQIQKYIQKHTKI